MAPGFPSREQVRQRYAERSGRDLSEIDFYVALGLWKLAIILEGVFARYSAGQYGDAEDSGAAQFARTVEAPGRRAGGRGRRPAGLDRAAAAGAVAPAPSSSRSPSG